MFTLVTGIVGHWRAVCVTALQRPNSDAAAIRIVVGIAAASLSVTIENTRRSGTVPVKSIKHPLQNMMPGQPLSRKFILSGLNYLNRGKNFGQCQKKVEICDHRLVKAQWTESGSSPSKRRVPFADQLQFILTSRNLRRTEGNVRVQTPPVHEGNSPEHGVGEEVEDFPMCSSPNPPLPTPSSSMYAAVTAPSCTEASSSSAVDAALVSTTVAPASGTASSSAGGASRPTGMGAGSARPVPLRYTVGKFVDEGSIIFACRRKVGPPEVNVIGGPWSPQSDTGKNVLDSDIVVFDTQQQSGSRCDIAGRS
ncbi:unnamed protein product [Ranitomeya imitator]|uniref:Uncharacterized protein n=1 Tax=Ranitomeya imitator TaxID=111125 RepID=A0ABN9LVB8_9NEOB|nr:unnamed protein product [Ranitomeya imitator]